MRQPEGVPHLMGRGEQHLLRGQFEVRDARAEQGECDPQNFEPDYTFFQTPANLREAELRSRETLSPRDLYIGRIRGNGVGVDDEFEGTPLPVLYSAHGGALKIPGALTVSAGGERNPDPEAARVLWPTENSLGPRGFEFDAEVPHVHTHRG